MFNFLNKEHNEYQTFNSDIFIGSKIVFKEKLKTFLWLPTNTVETPHIYFYFDNYKFYIAFGSVQNYQEIKLT